MKNIFPFFSLLLILNSNAQAQTQFPFSGYELNNYEIGDTLEYEQFYKADLFSNYCISRHFFTVINKEILGTNDSIRFTVTHIFNGISQYCGSWGGMDTSQWIIKNDTVYNNSNNLIQVMLYKLNYDTTIIQQPFDSTFVLFDTIGGLKNLKSHYGSWSNYYRYHAIENIGLIYWHDDYEFGLSNDIDLIYAHLSNYGVFGTYIPVIYNSINAPEKTQEQISLSPNPATNEIKITNLSPTENQISIFNLLGLQVKSIRVSNALSTTIPVSYLPAGIYVVTIFDGEKIVCKKLVKE